MIREEQVVGTIDPTSFTIEVCGKTAKLTKVQFEIFMALHHANGRTLTATFLQDALESFTRRETESNVLPVHIANLRRRMKPTGIAIETVWGSGYRLPKTEFTILPELEWTGDMQTFRQSQEMRP